MCPWLCNFIQLHCLFWWKAWNQIDLKARSLVKMYRSSAMCMANILITKVRSHIHIAENKRVKFQNLILNYIFHVEVSFRKYCMCYVIFEHMHCESHGDISNVRVSWSKDMHKLSIDSSNCLKQNITHQCILK